MLGILLPLLALLAGALSAGEAPPLLPKPSPNAGKLGIYEVQCGTAGYSYFVDAVERPNAGRAYGLHIFFHGQGSSGGAHSFGSWEAKLLKPFGLIGINMSYADGDNMKDTGGKVAAARAAVLQVMADYPVAPGRGIAACHSGGGCTCGMWYGACGSERGLAWPFSVLALHGANFWVPVQKGPVTGWFIGLAKGEWEMGKPILGMSQNARFGEVLGQLDSQGLDQSMRIVDGGHGVHDPEVIATARLFTRIDAFVCPFLYLPEWSERPLAVAAALANSGQLGAASQMLGKIKEGKVPVERISALQTAIDAHAVNQLAVLTELAGRDMLQATYYLNLAKRSLKDHPRAAELKALSERIAKDRPKAIAAQAALAAVGKAWTSLFPGRAALNTKMAPLIEQALKALGDESDLGILMRDILTLPRADVR